MYVCTCIDRKSKPYIWKNIRYICLSESDLACLVVGRYIQQNREGMKERRAGPRKSKVKPGVQQNTFQNEIDQPCQSLEDENPEWQWTPRTPVTWEAEVGESLGPSN